MRGRWAGIAQNVIQYVSIYSAEGFFSSCVMSILLLVSSINNKNNNSSKGDLPACEHWIK